MKPFNINMWKQALTVMPRIEKEEWDGLDFVSRWLISTRAAAILLTFFSAAIAALIAVQDGVFVWWKWLLITVGLIFAHATNNLLNDYTDHSKGIDEGNYFREQYGPHPLGKGFFTTKSLLRYAFINGLIALAIGVILILLSGPIVLYFTIAGAIFVLFYTYPLKHIAMGEIIMVVAWGPLMVGGGYYVMSGVWDWNVAWAGLAYSLGVTATLFGKHIDKFDMDKEKGVNTMPVVLGEKTSRYVTLMMFAAEYVIIIWQVISGYFTVALLLILLAVPAFIKMTPVFMKPRPEEKPEEYPDDAWPLWFVGFSFVYTRQWGSLFLLGLIIDTILKVFFLN